MPRLLPMAVCLAVLFVPLSVSASKEPCRTVDPNDAQASGEAAVLQILQGPGAPMALSQVSASQAGPGYAGQSNDTASFYAGGLVHLRVAPATANVTVVGDPMSSGSWTQASALDVDILDGLVTADAVHAATYATSDVRSAHTDSGSSEVAGLKIQGVSVTRVAPGLRVALPLAFGPGSFVAVEERREDSTFPTATDHLWLGDVTMRMIHVFLADSDPTQLGAQPLEIVVGLSHSHAQTPTPFCSIQQYGYAGAYVARIRPHGGWGTGILVGEQHTGPVDGVAQQELAGQSIPAEGETLVVGASKTVATTLMHPAIDSTAHAEAEVSGVCLALDSDGGCLVSAESLKTTSDSFANATRAVSWGHTTIVGLKVAGVDVCQTLGLQAACSPAYNTVLQVGDIKVVLNEHEHTSPQPGHTDLAVRAVHLSGPRIGDVYLARSFSEASDYNLDG